MTYNVNDIFTDNEEYSTRAQWCNENGCYIKEIEPLEDGSRQFKICEIEHNEELEQSEQELTITENRINEIKDELLTAILLGDTDLQNELKEQYTALLSEDDTEDSTDEVDNGNQE